MTIHHARDSTVARTGRKPMRLIAIAVLILVAVGAVVLIAPAQQPGPGPAERLTLEIQAAIDRLPRGDGNPHAHVPIGGIVTLPAGTIFLTQPLRLPSAVTLRGQGNGTLLRFAGKGAAIYLHSYAAHGSVLGAAVEDLAIYTDDADGIALDDSAKGEAAHLSFKNLTLSTGGTALNLRNPSGRITYFVNVENVNGVALGGAMIDSYVRELYLTRLIFSNQPRKRSNPPPKAMVLLDGTGVIEKCRFEGNWGCPILYATGTKEIAFRGMWTWRHNYVENQAPLPDMVQMTFEHSDVDADYFMFVQPQEQVELRNEAVVRFSVDPGHQSNAGMPADPKDCFKLDETSKIYLHGQLLLPK
jgi:hypothetical protein